MGYNEYIISDNVKWAQTKIARTIISDNVKWAQTKIARTIMRPVVLMGKMMVSHHY